MIILTAMIIVLVVAAMVSQMYLFSQRRGLRQEEFKELIGSVDADFQRALVRTLAEATHRVTRIQGYDLKMQPNSGNLTAGRVYAHEFMNLWRLSLDKAFEGLGLAVTTDYSRQVPLQPGKGELQPRYLKNLMKLYWYKSEALSVIGGDLSVDIKGLGFYGFQSFRVHYLNVSIDLQDLQSQASYDHLKIHVNREGNDPVPALGEKNFAVYNFNTTVGDWTGVALTEILYDGSGCYELRFEPPNPGCDPYSEWFHVFVEDNRGILVEALSYNSFTLLVNKHTPVVGRPADTDDEIYTLEAGVSGKWYWQMRELGIEGTYVPMPSIPIKQYRVNVTETGSDGQLEISPVQYEIWDKSTFHGPQVPVQIPRALADPTYRFNSSNRIVLQAKFPTLDTMQQKAKIWWFSDLDAQAYQGPTDLSYDPDAHQAETNRYRVEFLDVDRTSSPDYYNPNTGIPYNYYGVAALLMKNPSTGLTFGPWNIHAFGTHPSLAEWRPYGRWNVVYGYGNTLSNATVRLIAVVNSTAVQCPYQESHHEEDYYDTLSVVFITANTKYMQMKTYIYWESTEQDYGLWFATIMGGGGPTHYAYLDYDDDIQGPIAYVYQPPSERQHREYGAGTPQPQYDDPGHWAAQWNDQFGRGIIIDNEGLTCLRSLDAARTRFSVTESAPGGGDQGSMEYEAVNCGRIHDPPVPYPLYTASAGTRYNYLWAMWMYGGGDLDGYQEVDDYYVMFLELYAPTIEYQ